MQSKAFSHHDRPDSGRLKWVFRADADLKLLGSRRLPKDAFKTKVVWITGASQVLYCALSLS